MIVDTSALYAFYDRRDKHHKAVAEIILNTAEPLLVSPYVVAELDHFLVTRLGVSAELEILSELTSGAWDILAVSITDLKRATEIVAKYRDVKIGITDAMNIALAERTSSKSIATLDRRHFNLIELKDGKMLNIVP